MRTVEAQIKAPANEGFPDVLTPDALDFLGRLHREVEPVRTGLLEKRAEIAEKLRNGGSFQFLTETADARKSAWRVADAHRAGDISRFRRGLGEIQSSAKCGGARE